MPAATLNAGATAAGSPQGGGSVPFVVGTNLYETKMFSDVITPGTTTQEFIHNVTPGGFLRGIRLVMTSSGGGGTTAGVVGPDGSWGTYNSVSLENVDGSPIIYPMGGFPHYVNNKYSKPWLGDPQARASYAAASNPGCSLFISPEIRDTAGVLANTDARSQYRIKYTVDTVANIWSTAPVPVPTITVTGYVQVWAQPDSQDLHGRPITQVPDGLAISTLNRHQVITVNNSDNTFQLTNMGTEIRNLILITRNASGVRTNLLSDPVRFQVDNRQFQVSSPSSMQESVYDFYAPYFEATLETGVYVWPRFRNPGTLQGQFWYPTSNATYFIIETAGSASGTLEAVTSEVVPLATVPGYLEGC